VVTAARRFDHDVLLMTADEGPAGLRRIAASAMVDGVLVMDVEMTDARAPVLRELARPSVLIGFPADAGGLTCVDLDFHAAGARCAEHLAGLGHRRIALLGAPPVVYERDTGFAHRTRAGFLEATEKLGLTASARACGESLPEVREVLGELFAGEPGITGLVVHNEAAVTAVLTVLAELGRRVPDDVSVVAICPDQVAMSAVPPLSSVLIPAEEVGRQAVGLLMRKLGGSGVPEATLLIPDLTERRSTKRVVYLTA
jgi:DNA-binding LacI/PurR family transcriptional regulator